jgi:hypothetical protein
MESAADRSEEPRGAADGQSFHESGRINWGSQVTAGTAEENDKEETNLLWHEIFRMDHVMCWKTDMLRLAQT